FLTQLFHTDATPLKTRTQRDAQVARFKKEFVSKRVAKVQNPAADAGSSTAAAEAVIRILSGAADHDPEFAFAVAANRLLDLEREYPRGGKELTPSAEARASVDQIRSSLRASGVRFDEVIIRREHADSPEAIVREAASVHAMADLLVEWTAARWKAGAFAGWSSFRLPKPVAFDRLVPALKQEDGGIIGDAAHYRRRDGFGLTDPRFTPRQVTDQSNYCIFCHERQKDSCTRGLTEKDKKFKVNPLGISLQGCPLDERIGEMNFLRAEGDSVAGLAI